MEGLSIALGAFSFALKIGRRLLVEKRLKDGDTTSIKTLCQIILTDIDEVKTLLERQKQLTLSESLHLFEEGIRYLDEVLSNESRDEKEMKGQAAELKKDCPWTCLSEADLLIKNIERLKTLPHQGEAAIKVSKAIERFQQAREKARNAFWNDSLQTSDVVLAANIGVTSVILENYRMPWIAMQEYQTWLKHLNGMKRVKETFKRATKGGGISSGDQKNCLLGVCHINRVIHEITQIAVSGEERSWIWSCIQLGEERVDPLRDARLAAALAKLNIEHYSLTLTFGQTLKEEEENLKFACDIAVTKEGNFLIVDEGDQKIKTFDRKGNLLPASFSPLRRRLNDQDVRGVTTDREDKVLVLIKLDKYHHEIYVFDQQGNLQNKFHLREGLVPCSPIVNDKNEILVVNEKPDSERAVVEVYKDLQYAGSMELNWEPKEQTEPSKPGDTAKGSKQRKDASEESKVQKKAEHSKSTKDTRKPKEPEDRDTKEQFQKSQEPKGVKKAKDIAIADNGSVLVLNSDGSVDELKDEVQTEHRRFKGIPLKGVQAIAFHPLSKHVLIANSSEGIVNISVYAEDGELVNSFYADEERSGKKEKTYIAPKIAVTAEGRIAVLTGFVGESKVIVV